MSQRKRHILVVEDEAMIALLLRKLLEHRGYEVSVAGDGLSALEQLAAHPADLVITDMKMPKLGGNDLIRALRLRFPNLAVIMTTGFLEFSTQGSGIDGIEVLYKPVESRELLAAVERALAAAAAVSLPTFSKP